MVYPLYQDIQPDSIYKNFLLFFQAKKRYIKFLFHNIWGVFILNVQIDLKKGFDKKKKGVKKGKKIGPVKNFGRIIIYFSKNETIVGYGNGTTV